MNDKELEQYLKLKKSINYQFCNVFLPGLFFYKPEMFMLCLKKEEYIPVAIKIALEAMQDVGFDTTGYENLKYTIKINKEPKVFGLILEIPNPEIEPECNFVCLCFTEEGPIFYESELYEGGYFGLCVRTEDGRHMNYGTRVDDIKTPHERWDAIMKI